MAGIRIEGVGKSYPLPGGSVRQALVGIDATVANGEFVALLGPSGCGKTTLLNILSGLDSDYRGRVFFTDGSFTESRFTEGRGRTGSRPKFSYMFQESRLLPWFTVQDNLRFVLDDRKRRDDLIADWLERVGLEGALELYPSQLSVGMQQRVALVRALIVEPQILFMDEPLSALDELTASQMRDELLALWAQQQSTVVFVTHNPVEAVYLADRVLVMSPGPGRIVAELDVREELSRPRDPEDTRVWKLSRRCVRILRGQPPGTQPREVS